jgi:hypothetical protein
MLTRGMPQLRRLCLWGCEDSVTVDDVVAAVTPPLLPALKQLAIVDVCELDTIEKQTLVQDKVKQARAVDVIAAGRRGDIPPDFVGALAYSG